MSRETIEWLNENVLIGNTDKRGTAWHYRASAQGEEPNHYPGFIPVDDVLRRLFNWEIVVRPSLTTAPCDIADPEMSGIDNLGHPYKLVWIKDEKRLMRSDTNHLMGPAFKDGYQPHQYPEWLVDNVATILGGDLGISSAGLLRGGAVAWVEVSVPDSIESPQGVVFRPNMLAATSCDGSVATGYGRTITDTVCDNTMGGALREKGQKIKYKHSRYSNLRSGEAREALAMVYSTTDDYLAQLAYLDSIKVTPAEFSKFVDLHVLTQSDGKVKEWADLSGRSLTMAQNKRDGLLKLYRFDQRVEPWAGTALGVVKAVNTFVHHEGIVRGADRAERNMLNAVEGKWESLDRFTLDQLLSVTV